MKIVRFAAGEGKDDSTLWGVIEGESVTALSGSPFGGIETTDMSFPISKVRLLSPVIPGKIVAIGYNYIGHIEEMGVEIPKEPLIFLKASSAVIGAGDEIVRPPESERVDFEGELAVVIGTPCRRVASADADEVVFGYTILNDVTARDLQRKDVQFSRGKSFDTFSPIGPWIETDFDPSASSLSSSVNGEIRQEAAISSMVFSPADLVSYVSQSMTLHPGDIIATGTPSGVGPLVEGDEVSISVDGIGVLTNPVRNETP